MDRYLVICHMKSKDTELWSTDSSKPMTLLKAIEMAKHLNEEIGTKNITYKVAAILE